MFMAFFKKNKMKKLVTLLFLIFAFSLNAQSIIDATESAEIDSILLYNSNRTRGFTKYSSFLTKLTNDLPEETINQSFEIDSILVYNSDQTKGYVKYSQLLAKMKEDINPTILKAFPSAYGGGANVSGGRGGVVVHVTNLSDDGRDNLIEGSLRYALRMTVPRIIVFDVSGDIVLTDMVELISENSNFTIAGQTAPQGGITISGFTFQLGGGYNKAQEPCDNVIIRHVRFRNTRDSGQVDDYLQQGLKSTGTNGIVLDHCSFSFCYDQSVSLSSNYGHTKNITMSRNLFSQNTTGVLIGNSASNFGNDVGNATYINNLHADQSYRTPNGTGNLQFDIINNITFNNTVRVISTSRNMTAPYNYIGNYIKTGSSSSTSLYDINQVKQLNSTYTQIYTGDNYHSLHAATPAPNDRQLWSVFGEDTPLTDDYFVDSPYNIVGQPYNIKSAVDAYNDVLADVGTNKYIDDNGYSSNYQDSFDTLKIQNVINDISGDPNTKTGVLPTLPNNTRPAWYDTDNDGMSDDWEMRTFGNLNQPANGDYNGDGYNNIENFFNQVDE